MIFTTISFVIFVIFCVYLYKRHLKKEGRIKDAKKGDHSFIIKQVATGKRKLNDTDEYGNTALTSAILHAKVELAQELLGFGANPHIYNKENHSAFTLAIQQGFIGFIQHAIKNRVPIKNDFPTANSVIYAVISGYYELVFELLKNGLDPNIKGSKGFNLMTVISMTSYSPLIEYQLQKNPNINIRDDLGGTPLLYASSKGILENVKLLVESGADINASNLEGKTPLIVATGNDFSSVVEYLLLSNADVNATTKNGNTALDIAKNQNNEKLVQLIGAFM